MPLYEEQTSVADIDFKHMPRGSFDWHMLSMAWQGHYVGPHEGCRVNDSLVMICLHIPVDVERKLFGLIDV